MKLSSRFRLCHTPKSDELAEYGNGTIILGKQILQIPKKFKANKEEIKDKRLEIKVLPCSPCLQVNSVYVWFNFFT